MSCQTLFDRLFYERGHAIEIKKGMGSPSGLFSKSLSPSPTYAAGVSGVTGVASGVTAGVVSGVTAGVVSTGTVSGVSLMCL